MISAPSILKCRSSVRQNGVLIMKKFVALFLAVGMSTALFASCNNNNETTTETTDTLETTSGSETTDTSATTSTPAESTFIFVDPEMYDSLRYDYIVRTVKDNNESVIGVAVQMWKQSKASSEIVIDSEYTADNGATYPVIQVGVGQGVLSFQSQLESITIPASVQTIAKKSFMFCSSLKTLNLSEGLETIGEMAFWNCTALETLVIPSTVTTIERMAFAACESLKSVTLPRSFEDQIDDIFSGCPEDMVITYID